MPRNSQGNGSGANSGNGSNTGWLVPVSEVVDGGPGKDGIPALNNPNTIPVQEVNFLSDDDLVLGFTHGGEYRAYPHPILDWHEIINDELNGQKLAVTYCPLTGTGIGWSRVVDGKETTFGVSGLLYNSNLIPYDRLTDSNWGQINLTCINGSEIGEQIETYHMIETTFKTWTEMFPNSTIVSTETGFGRNYNQYPYGPYKTNNDMILFPVDPLDERLPAKERVLAVIINGNAKVYRLNRFHSGGDVLIDQYSNKDLVIIGDLERNFLVAFENELNGYNQQFTLLSESSSSAVFQDELGNQYNLFGEIVSGPDQGKTLPAATSFMAYWFSIAPFYRNTDIFGFN